MKTRFFFVVIILGLLTGCDRVNEANTSQATAIAKLEARVAALEAQAATAEKSMNIKSDLIDTAGVLEFFKNETTVMDVGLSGCSSDCARDNVIRRLGCAETPDVEWCSNSALSAKADKCQADCVKHFERPLVQ
ncbi:MAG: hypothetical protein AB8F65_10785 [Woeseiaceae bacterium]